MWLELAHAYVYAWNSTQSNGKEGEKNKFKKYFYISEDLPLQEILGVRGQYTNAVNVGAWGGQGKEEKKVGNQLRNRCKWGITGTHSMHASKQAEQSRAAKDT